MTVATHALPEGLTQVEADMLDFERTWYAAGEPKEQVVVQRFNMNVTRYYQKLNLLIDRPEALLYSPLLVKRLRRLRAQRKDARSAKRLG